MKNTDHIVIIGNGIAANRAAEVIRGFDRESRLTLISREFFVFYHRHRLPEFITGMVDEQDLAIRNPDYYRERNIRLRLGQTVRKIDLKNKTLFLSHMEKVHYSRLLICSGGIPHIPEIYYPYRPFFTTLKKLSDARGLKKRLPMITKIVILGGDLTSIRLADALMAAGKQITFILDDFAFWPVESGAEMKSTLAAVLQNKGFQVISDDPLERIEQISQDDPPEYRVRTRSGHVLQAEMVGAFFGFRPDVDFLIRSGLDIDRGILVDDKLQTAHPDIYAAGDCAQVYVPHLKNYWVSIGWRNASILGEVAAHNIMGTEKTASYPGEQRIQFGDMYLRTPWWQSLKEVG